MDALRSCATGVAVLIVIAASGPPAQAAADPLDPAAPVPPTQSQSVLRSAPAIAPATVGSWREANDTVTRIGGWKAYAREASTNSVPESQSPAAKPQSAPATAPDHRHH